MTLLPVSREGRIFSFEWDEVPPEIRMAVHTPPRFSRMDSRRFRFVPPIEKMSSEAGMVFVYEEA